MPSVNDNPAAAAILSILLESKQAGVGKLMRTVLMKYLYLLDLFMAEETSGKTWTGALWRFHHFGPYADSLAAEIDKLAALSLIADEARERGDKDYTLYTIGEWSQARTLEALGFPLDVRMRLTQVIRKFANDLSSLLDMVYFNTEPMRNVRPGEELRFDAVEKLNYKVDVRPIRILATDPEKNAKVRNLARKIGESYAKRHVGKPLSPAPIRDALFEQAILSDEEDTLAGDFSAELTFDR